VQLHRRCRVHPRRRGRQTSSSAHDAAAFVVPAIDFPCAIDSKEDETSDAWPVHPEVVSTLSDVETCDTEESCVAAELKGLKERGVTTDRICEMDYALLASRLAA
jgi:hypothetical protein